MTSQPNEHKDRSIGFASSSDQLLFTTEEAADVLRVGRTTIYALIRSGDLRPVHIGRCCRISRGELDRYVTRLDSVPSNLPVPLRGPGYPEADEDCSSAASSPQDAA